MSRNERRFPEGVPKSDVDIDGARRQLKRWVVERSVACAAFAFAVALLFTHGPFPQEPNYVLAGLIGGAAGALIGGFLAIRAYLCLQRVLAERAGATLSYWMGQQLRTTLAKKTAK